MYISKMSTPALCFPDKKPGLSFDPSSLPDSNIKTLLCLGEDAKMLSMYEVCVWKIYGNAESSKTVEFLLFVFCYVCLGLPGICTQIP